jgi:hypothetical protein
VIVISSLGCFDDSKCRWNGDLIMIWRKGRYCKSDCFDLWMQMFEISCVIDKINSLCGLKNDCHFLML